MRILVFHKRANVGRHAALFALELVAVVAAFTHDQIADLDKQIDKLLERIVDATNERVIRTYEDKIAGLERQKIILAEKLANQAEPKGSFEEKLEPVLTFLASPWKLWETGQITLRRTVLKLAFADRLEYCRIEGPRTAQIALPFKALGGFCDKTCKMVPLSRVTSNSEGDELFEILTDWNEQLKHIDPAQLEDITDPNFEEPQP